MRETIIDIVLGIFTLYGAICFTADIRHYAEKFDTTPSQKNQKIPYTKETKEIINKYTN